MVNYLEFINIKQLLAATSGRAEIVVGIIDGPVQGDHPDLQAASIRALPAAPEVICQTKESIGCVHGTFIAGILCAQRESQAPGLCPDCTVLVKPILCDLADLEQCPKVTPENLASAVKEVIDAGARVINLSLGLPTTSLQEQPVLQEAFDYAFQKGVLIVGAAGNQGRLGRVALFDHPWTIPVAACNMQGELYSKSNSGISVGKSGLMAPGVDIVSTYSGGGYTQMTGTSAATPFVTGTIALLWSLFPQATAGEIRRAILRPDIRRKSIIPPLLNAEASWRTLSAKANY
ncbi:S8 family serine peptidase [Okeania sp. SIO2B3]|uniref:S8 family peptidase n=1 Tax=Okeania sp. SIO2B3 TaxID=2607784 RepID=UPI0013BF67A8|nr:S8 family serine peptidase [Okeania sp. SIO2B3]NET46285.1 S8 family serine peptidase [Okeania sp. SIO2B3]